MKVFAVRKKGGNMSHAHYSNLSPLLGNEILADMCIHMRIQYILPFFHIRAKKSRCLSYYGIPYYCSALLCTLQYRMGEMENTYTISHIVYKTLSALFALTCWQLWKFWTEFMRKVFLPSFTALYLPVQNHLSGCSHHAVIEQLNLYEHSTWYMRVCGVLPYRLHYVWEEFFYFLILYERSDHILMCNLSNW